MEQKEDLEALGHSGMTHQQQSPERQHATPTGSRSNKRMKSSIEFMLNNPPTFLEPNFPSPSTDAPTLPRLNSIVSFERLREPKVARLTEHGGQNFSYHMSGGSHFPHRATGSNYFPGQPQFQQQQQQFQQQHQQHQQTRASIAVPSFYAAQQRSMHAQQQQQLPSRANFQSVPSVLPAAYSQGTSPGYAYPKPGIIPVISRKHPNIKTDPDDLVDGDKQHPKLKYSHKIAERKRRKDMNDTFEELKATLPTRGAKMSKWEILMTASEYIDELHERKGKLAVERETLHRELGIPVSTLVKSKK